MQHTIFTIPSNNLDKVFTRLLNQAVGFEPLLQRVYDDNVEMNGYPPYNIERIGENDYRISIAVAGISMNDISITEHDGYLTVYGKSPDEDDSKAFIHKGIATRAFRRQFRLAEYVNTTNATLSNGILTIDLHREVPIERQPKNIPISNGIIEGTSQINNSAEPVPELSSAKKKNVLLG